MTPRMGSRDNARSRLIVALDVSDRSEALRLVKQLHRRVGLFKVGLELFTAEGPGLIREIRHRGEKIFLDLKLHDIPNTVAGAVRSAARLEVEMLSVHASGGRAMLQRASRSLEDIDSPPLLLAVTALTSLSPEDVRGLGIAGEVEEWVDRLAEMAIGAGIRGLVCSPLDATRLRRIYGPRIRIITPGVRPTGGQAQDQSRTATPLQAIQTGADYLVVGRPILQAPDPAAAAEKIVDEIEAAISVR